LHCVTNLVVVPEVYKAEWFGTERRAPFDLPTRFRRKLVNRERGWDCVTHTDNGSVLRSFGGSEPTFLNHHAWSVRWQDRARSHAMAQAVLDFSRVAGSARAVGSRRRNGLAMRTLAWQALWRGDFENAESLAHRALARLKGEGAESAMADVLSTLAFIQCARGRRDLARECIAQGFECLVQQPNEASRIDLLIGLATVERHTKRMRAAQDKIGEAIAIATGSDLARAEQSVARALLQEDLPREALEHAVEAVDLARQHRSRVVLPYALEVKAGALIELDRFDDAASALEEATAMSDEDGDRRLDCHITYRSLVLNRKQGDRETATTLAYRGQEIAGSIGYQVLEKKFLDQAARLDEELGRTGAALSALKRLIALRESERE
jgi:tetratricopeptide (TPR) repeat protein